MQHLAEVTTVIQLHPTMTKRLTARAVLLELVRMVDALEPTPSTRDLADRLGVTHGAIQYHARTLRAEGYMRADALWPTVAGYNWVKATRATITDG